jgi:hypothetical protein
MKISKRELRAMREEVRQGPDRSSLYWWMVDHHAALLAEGKAGRMPWLKLCKRFIARGLTDGQGKPPTPLRASRTWRDATIEVKAAANRAAASPPVPSRPSRQRADWQPPLVEAPRTAPALPYRRYEPEEELPPRRPSALPPSQAPPATSKPMTIDDLTPEARAKIERVKSELAAEDRKRFGHL